MPNKTASVDNQHPAQDTHVKLRGDTIAINSDSKTPVLKLKLLEVLTNGEFHSLETFVQEQQGNDTFKELLPLLLNAAVQVSQLPLIQDIVSKWVNNPTAPFPLNINEKDEDGNTPLHLAAAQSRSDVIELLLDQPTINECAVNNAQLLPFEMCKNVNIAQMMQIKRANYISTIQKQAFEAAKANDFKTLDTLYKNHRNSEFLRTKFMTKTHIEGANDDGDNLLHYYIEKKNVKMCNWLLDHGADPTTKNNKGQTPIDLLSEIIKKIPQQGQPNAVNSGLVALNEKLTNEKLILAAANKLNEPPTYKGFLKKFTNFAQGYKLRWFVLSADGKLSYYKDQASSSKSHARGSLNLKSCYLHLDSTEKLKFELIGGHGNTTKWQLKGNHPVETNNWVWAIQGAIRYARDKEMLNKNNKSSNVSPAFVMNRNATQTTFTSNATTNSKSTPMPLTHGYTDSQLKESTKVLSHTSANHKFSTANSIHSADIELSDNLTKSGKDYVNKMIETRLESTSPTEQLSPKPQSLDPMKNKVTMMDGIPTNMDTVVNDTVSASSKKSGHGSVKHTSTNNTTYSSSKKYYTDGEDDSEDNQDEDGIAVKFEKDEEYLKIEYGPYIEKLNVFQKTVGFELDSIDEILSSKDFLEQKNPETVVVVRRSLKKVYQLINQMNRLTSQRDERLISMLTKQSDENNVWIQSVRDLEVELGQKSERLASLDKERKSLKKTLHKKLIESSELDSQTPESESSSFLAANSAANRRSSIIKAAGITNAGDDSTDTLAQIAKFISATRQEDENTDDDEFYDAEELMNEIDQSAAEETTKTSESISASKNQEETLNDETVSTTINEPMDIPKLATPSSIPDIPNIAINGAEVTEANTNDKMKDLKEVKKTESSAAKLARTVSLAVSDIAKTTSQQERANNISSEKTYKGYEDGIRKRLKLDEDDRPKISLWAVLKSMVGKDMTRMTLPVSFNEPTSLLQRVAEDLEYSELLDQAASFEDSTLRCLYTAIFTASCYASTTKRVAKPFNPLLGETYEYARPDKHFRFFTEQVSHHPPISATWTESPKWDFWGESHVETKFNGRSFGVQHLGLWHIKIRPDCDGPEDFYTYKKPDNTVIGILVGNPQVDNHGEVRITNHVTGDTCVLNFKARGWRSSGAFEVTGEVFNKKKEKVWVLGGHWNDSIYAKKVTKGKNGANLTLEKTKTNSSRVTNGPNYEGNKFLVWKVAPRPDAPFHLTPFAITLNAPQPKLVPWLAPTDTRLRPDQRAMEDGEYDRAAEEKHRLEEKQRAVRKERETKNETYSPKWFTKDTHPITKRMYWKSTGKYWDTRKDKNLKDVSYDIF
ncbi:similar to Saccharomyces cerevisiae YAR042W SWH1 Protein similar to mammalian oxysterol-binding protein [Maudiozyma saulgeensis]|uniref:Similar to Saccharomyces cerevisiae YAR042W SWH1 Protein similar to mammalian oxysterol-binding protein n=1 Tax=Maudiozyma saulgeensis TaxID=1789683 RepID=A0A1X7R3W0_9SACH|nr:similar to Saccharomyces cerevisiae YAR042W SWH1 Protein similar to mammalian oxysterol-binding protein [Kazachstania saulgeensis]